MTVSAEPTSAPDAGGSDVDDLVTRLRWAEANAAAWGRPVYVLRAPTGRWVTGTVVPADEPYIVVHADGTSALSCDSCGAGDDGGPILRAPEPSHQAVPDENKTEDRIA